MQITGTGRAWQKWWRVAMLLLTCAYAPVLAQTQATLGTGQIQILGLGVDVDTRPDVDGLQYTMTAVRDIPSGALAVVGAPGVPPPPGLPVGSLVKAEMSGPGLAQTVTVAALPNQLIEFPIFRVAGDYHLFNIRLEDPQGNVILRRDPSLPLVVVNVIDELLVTQVTSRPLTAEEIRERGIIIDENSFTVVNFTVGLTLGSEQVTIDLPTVIPNPGAGVLSSIEIPRMPAIQLPASTFEKINIPNFSLTGFSVVPPPELKEAEGITLPPIQGVIIIPGNIAFLNQFFSVIVQTTNQAPQFSGLVVNAAKASSKLPTGDDGILGSGDDPLRIAATNQGTFSELPLLDENGQPRISPQKSSSAEFLIEGLREGTHVVDFRISGDLFVPQLNKNFPVTGLAAGVVQVKNPSFSITLAHPDVVREAEAYSIFATVTNTSTQPANLFQLRLNGRSLSGARLADGETGVKQLDSLAPGQAESFEFKMVARTTGQVSGTVFLADPSINGSFVLTTGVGDTGVPLSPDTLVLPQTAQYLPDEPDLLFAVVRMLGQAYSVATAPAGALPPDIARINKSFVFDRAVKLAQVGLHVRLGEDKLMAVQDILLDLFGNDLARLGDLFPDDPQKVARLEKDWDAFDALRRRANAGQNLTNILAQSLAAQAAGRTLSQMMREMAENFVSRPAHLALAADSPDSLFAMRIIDKDLRRLGRLTNEAAPNRDIPFADILTLERTSDTLKQILFIGSPDSPVYLMDFQSPKGGLLKLSLTIAAPGGGLLHLNYPPTNLAPGANGRMVWRDGEPNAFIFEIDIDADGVPDLNLVPDDLTPVADSAPGVIAVQQWMKGAAPSSKITFGEGDPLGRLMVILFDEEVEAASAELPANYTMPGHTILQAVLQPDRRVVFAVMDRPAGPFVPRDLTIASVGDLTQLTMPPTPLPLAPDPDRGIGGVVEGRLLTAEGAPLAGVEVRYIQPILIAGPADGQVEDRVAATYTTDADGKFLIDFVLQNAQTPIGGDIWLNVRGAGPTNHFKLEGTDPQTGAPGRASTRISFDGQRMNVDVIMRGAGGLQGRLFKEDGTPLAGRTPATTNTLFIFATNLSTGERSFTFVDEQGFYAFPRSFVHEDGTEFETPSLSVGNILVQVIDPVSATTGIGTANIPRAGATAQLDLIMVAANHFGKVRGRVLERGGETGAANVRVFVSAPFVTGISLTNQSTGRGVVGATVTDSAGNFEFDNVPIGELRFRAIRDATFEQADATAFLDLGGEANVTLILPGTGGTVRGFVRDALGNLVPHAPVAGGPTLTEAGDNGFFEITNLPLGKFTITARDTFSRATGRQEVEILNPGDVQEIIITLEPVGSIRGTVFKADGVTRAAGQQVQLWVEPNRGVIGEMKTDADGNFEFINFPVGQYTIRAIEKDLGDGGMANAAIRFAGDQVDADVFFRGLGQIKGRVIQSNGTPVISDVIVTNKVWRIIPGEQEEIPNYYLDYLAALSAQSDELAGIVEDGLSRSGFTQNTGVFFFLLDQSAAIKSNILGPGGQVTGEFHFTGPATGGPFTVAAFGPFLSPAIVEGEIPRTTNPAERIVDVGDIVLEPSTGSVKGTVYMPDGVTPVGENVKVKLKSLDKSGEVPAIGGGISQPVLPELEVVTDPNGRFSFPLALRGSCVLTADTGAPPPAIKPQTAAEVFTDAFQTTDGQRLLNVRLYGQANGSIPKGEELTLDITLNDMAGVAVTVFEADGVTSAGFARVTLRTGSTLDKVEEDEFLNNTADANGRIEFFPVIEGSFSVEATIPSTSRRGVASGSIPVNPPNGFVKPVKIVLGSATSDSGQIISTPIFGSVEGTVFRADGTPLTNPAEVRVIAGGANLLTTTDPSGHYQVDLVPGGFFRVEVFEPLTARRGTSIGQLTANNQTVVANVTLVGLGTVNGQVFDFDGVTPIGAADVLLFPSGNFTDTLVTRSDPTGRFSFPGVPLGSYTVRAIDQILHLTGENTGFMPADGATAVTDIFLEASASIEGTVYGPGVRLNAQGVPVDGENQPLPSAPVVPNATVTIRRGEFTQTVQAGADGKYKSGGALLLGNYTITAQPPAGQDGGVAQTSLTFNGQTSVANVALRGQGTVTGIVLDSLGLNIVGLARATLTSQSPFSNGPVSRITGGDGRFTFEEIPIGPFSISVVTTTQIPQLGASAQGELTVHGETIRFEDGDIDTTRAALRLQPSGSILGRVVLGDGVTPAVGAVIELSTPAPPALRFVHLADNNGAFTFEGLPLGSYNLLITEQDSNGRARRSVNIVSNGQVTDLGTITVDNTRPVVVSTVPVAGAASIHPSAPIVITFSELIDPATVSPDTLRILVGGQPLAGTFAVSPIQPTITFTPAASIGDLKAVAVSIRADKIGFEDEVLQAGIRDFAGNSLVADFNFGFTTGDSTPPTLISLTPTTGSVEQSVNSLVRWEFNEPINPASIISATLTANGAPVAGSLNSTPILGGRVVVFSPSSPLQPDKTYLATLNGPIRDTIGNAMAQSQLATSFRTIDTLPPVIQSIALIGNPPTVGGTATIGANFADPGDVAFVEFYLNGLLVATDVTGPFAHTYSFLPEVGDEVLVAAVAGDQAGNRSPLKTLLLNIAPNQLPVVSIASPTGGQVSQGAQIFVLVNATDDIGVSQITFTANNGAAGAGSKTITPAATATSAIFSFIVPASIPPGGKIQLRATATDTLGASAPSAIVELSVIDQLPPELTFVSPAANSFVNPGQQVAITLRAEDAGGVNELKLDSSGAATSSQTQPFNPAVSPAEHTFNITVPPGALPTQQLALTARARDAAGNTRQAQMTLKIADKIAPQVTLALDGGGTLVEPGSQIKINLAATDSIGVASVTATAGALLNETRAITPAATGTQQSFTINVPSNLAFGATIQVNATATDTSGNIGTAATLTLTAADRIAPQVTLLAPLPGASVGPGQSLEVRISATDAIGVASIGFTATGASAASEDQTISPAATSAERAFTLNIPADAQPGAALSITARAKDAANNEGTAQALSLIISDTAGPTVLDITPANAATNVNPATNIVINFSEALDPASVTAQSVTLSTTGGNVAGSLALSNANARVTFTPSATLALLTTHTLTLTTAIKDAAGNAMATQVVSRFRTASPDLTGPKVTAIDPANNATDISIATSIRVTFSEPINPASISASTFQVTTGASPVAGAFSFASNNTIAIFTPTEALPLATVITTRLSNGIKDAADNALTDNSGNALGQPLTFTFTTGDFGISNPQDGSAVIENSQLLLEARGSAGLGIATVTFAVNGLALPAASGPPFTRNFTVPSASQTASLIIHATARRADSSIAAEDEITVNVAGGIRFSPRLIGVPQGGSANATITLSSPLAADLPIALSAVNPLIVAPQPGAVIPAGQTQVTLILQGLSTGSTTVLATSTRGTAAAVVSVSALAHGRAFHALAPLVGAAVQNPIIESVVFLPSNAQQTLTFRVLASPALSTTPVIVESTDASIVTVLGSPAVVAGQRVAPLTIQTGLQGEALLTLRIGANLSLVRVIIGAPTSERQPQIVASPIGINTIPPISAGSVFLQPNTQQTITLTLLSSPAPNNLVATIISTDPAVASVIGTVTVPAGSRTGTFTIQGGLAGNALLTINTGGELRTLSVFVGQDAQGRVPAFFAQPVGVNVLPPRPAGHVFLPENSLQSVTVPMLVNPAPSQTPIVVQSDNPAVAVVNAPAFVAAGARVVSLTIETGPAGQARLLLTGGGEVRELIVIVGPAPAGSVPAILASPVGINLLAPPSAGTVLMPPSSQRVVSVPVLSSPSPLTEQVTITTDNEAIAFANSPATLSQGSRNVSLTINSGADGTAELTLRTPSGIIRALTIIVGTPPPGSVPALIARPVGITIIPNKPLGKLILPENSNVSISLKLLNSAAIANTVVTASSSVPATVAVTNTPNIAIGTHQAQVNFATGPAGNAVVTFKVGVVSYDLQVAVTSAPDPLERPLIVARPVGLATAGVELNEAGQLISLQARNSAQTWMLYE